MDLGDVRHAAEYKGEQGENALTEDQYTDAVMEAMFFRGFACRLRRDVALIAAIHWQSGGLSPDPETCIDTLSRIPGSLRRATDLEKDTPWSSGAACDWIAVHEAAHGRRAIRSTYRGIGWTGRGGDRRGRRRGESLGERRRGRRREDQRDEGGDYR
jgi:hypothetical protein